MANEGPSTSDVIDFTDESLNFHDDSSRCNDIINDADLTMQAAKVAVTAGIATSRDIYNINSSSSGKNSDYTNFRKVVNLISSNPDDSWVMPIIVEDPAQEIDTEVFQNLGDIEGFLLEMDINGRMDIASSYSNHSTAQSIQDTDTGSVADNETTIFYSCLEGDDRGMETFETAIQSSTPEIFSRIVDADCSSRDNSSSSSSTDNNNNSSNNVSGSVSAEVIFHAVAEDQSKSQIHELSLLYSSYDFSEEHPSNISSADARSAEHCTDIPDDNAGISQNYADISNDNAGIHTDCLSFPKIDLHPLQSICSATTVEKSSLPEERCPSLVPPSLIESTKSDGSPPSLHTEHSPSRESSASKGGRPRKDSSTTKESSPMKEYESDQNIRSKVSRTCVGKPFKYIPGIIEKAPELYNLYGKGRSWSDLVLEGNLSDFELILLTT